MHNLISIIIPTYNRGSCICRAIDSALQQTYQNFELIIIDDASTDNTKEIINNYNNDRIIYIRHNVNKGAGAARNTGINASKGELISFLDSDDEWLPLKLEKQFNVLINASPEVGMVYTKIARCENGKVDYLPSMDHPKEGKLYHQLLKNNFISTHVLIKKSCFTKVGLFDESMPSIEDWELWIRISKVFLIKYIDEPLVNTYYQNQSISASNPRRVEGLKILLNKYSHEMRKNPILLSGRYFEIAYYNLCQINIKSSWNYYFKAVLAFPLYIILLIPFFVVFIIKLLKK